MLDLEAVGRACWQAGTYFFVNTTQGFGVRPLSARSLPVDAISCAGYKWLCGPYGTGFCWTRSDLLGRLRPLQCYWLPAARRTGFDSLDGILDVPPPRGPTRHDVFGTASFLNVLPWTAALEYLAEVGVDAASRHNERLVGWAGAAVAGCGYRILSLEGPTPSPFVVFDPGEGGAHRVAGRLKEANVHVALRDGLIRVSPHLHNDGDQIDRFEEALCLG